MRKRRKETCSMAVDSQREVELIRGRELDRHLRGKSCSAVDIERKDVGK